MQIRTRLQHIWATAVETVSTILGRNYKSKETKSDDWKVFFSLVSSAMAHKEGQSLVSGYESLSSEETFKKVAEMEKKLEFLNRISGYSAALNLIVRQEKKWFYHLIRLDTKKTTVEVQSYARDNFTEAATDYDKASIEANSEIDCVLVAAGPINLLKRAYPNYFLDISSFKTFVGQIVAEAKLKL